MAKSQTVAIKPTPVNSIEAPEMNDEEIKNRSPLLVSMHDIALCQRDLSDLIIQGCREDNSSKRGSVAAGLRRAAYRLEKLKLEGFVIEENRRLLPYPDTKVIFDGIRKLHEELGEAIRMTNTMQYQNAVGEVYANILKFLNKHDAPKKVKTMEE